MTLRRLGECLELESLGPSARAPLASAVESAASASVFQAPRAGADRYPDWADFEYACRLPAGTLPARVWRIAEDGHHVCYLGQSVHAEGTHFPMAAALWRGWVSDRKVSGRGLFWQGKLGGHLWVVPPDAFPGYVGFMGAVSTEALLVALSRHASLHAISLELGGVTRDFAEELSGLFPGSIMPAEPFAPLRVPAALRERLSELEDSTVYLPAVGVARVLLEGPPRPLTGL